MLQRFFSILLVLGLVCSGLLSQQPKPGTRKATANASLASLNVVDGIVKKAIEDHEIPGAVVLIGHSGRVVYRKAFGHRSLEPTVEAMTTDTVFDMASLTKCIATGMSVMRLIETGQVRLNDPVAKYIPDFAANGKDQITIRQLLTHYSGLRPDLDLDQPWQGYGEAMQRIYAEKPVNPPGARFVYSDINFETLGELVSRVSGMPLDKYARAHVFIPLGMTRTTFNPPPSWRAKIAPTQWGNATMNTPVGAAVSSGPHEMLRGVVHDPTARRMGGVAGHAGLFSTADDVSKFAQAMLDRKALDPLSIEKMTTPQQPPNATSLRGLAWDIDSPFSTNRGELLPVGSYGHTGFTGTSLWIDPATQTYVVILTNAVHPEGKGSAVGIRAKIATAVAAALQLTPSEKDQVRLASITGYNETQTNVRRIAARNGAVLTGIDVLEASDFKALKEGPKKNPDGPRIIGIMTNQNGVDGQGRRAIDVLANAPGIKLAAIFAPEHGATGTLDTTNIGNSVDQATHVPIYSVYGATDAARHPPLEIMQTLDAVVIDIQDVGVRYYTYDTHVGYFLEAGAKSDTEIVILDRPNPIGGMLVQGPVSDPGTENFVNYTREPTRHGMTTGELAKFFNGERHINARLTVVPMQGWIRGDWFDSTGLTWINPSPNLRTMNEEALYTGIGIIEGTNISVGRGTDTPFEWLGAPWIKARELSDYLNSRQIEGVRFLPVSFTPTSNRYANQLCNGVSMIVLDRYTLDGPELGIEVASALHKLYPNDYKLDHWMDLLANKATFDAVSRGDDPRFVVEQWRADLEAFMQIRQKYLIYPASVRAMRPAQ
jgi:uncharacterized protein YbbC (DUF1343 family)/CubicO group peptidase (beta-lactamase class C family)